MLNKTDNKVTALYYRTARRGGNPDMHLDNQTQQLLCYAQEQGLDDFILYADNGASGVTFDRPAMNFLKRDIAAGRVSRVIITDYSRLGRNTLSTVEFADWSKAHGVQIVCLNHMMAEGGLDFLAGLCTFVKGGAYK